MAADARPFPFQLVAPERSRARIAAVVIHVASTTEDDKLRRRRKGAAVPLPLYVLLLPTT